MRLTTSVAMSFFGGCATALCALRPPSSAWLWSAVAGIVIVGVVRLASASSAASPLAGTGKSALGWMLAWLLGFTQVSWVTHDWVATRVPLRDAGERWLVRGEVTTVPSIRADDGRFDALVRIVAPRDRAADPARTIRMQWRGMARAPAVGETWQWLIEVQAQPRARSAVDVERIWLRDRVHGEGRVLESAANHRVTIAPASVDALRERIAHALTHHVTDRDALALVRALAVGLTDQMTREQWRVFSATGTTHLVAISGMHVTLFAWLAFALARGAWRCVPGLWRRFDREPFALCVGWLAAAGYSALAGMSVPTQRTLLMLGAFAVMRIAARQTSLFHTFAVALIAVLVVDPLAPLGVGFWLSFGAVAAILWTAGTRLQATPAAATALRIQLVVLLALTPLTLVSFGTVSFASLVTNVFAIPITSFVLVPLVLVGAAGSVLAPPVAAVALGLAEQIYVMGWPALAAAADWPLATWAAEPSLVAYTLGWAGVLVAITPVDWRFKATGILAMLPLLWVPRLELPYGEARVELLDTGRGVMAIIATAQHTLLYDTGDSFGTDVRYLEAALRPWLAKWGRKQIDVAVLPRVTADRAAGIGRLIATTAVESVRGGGVWLGALVPFRPCRDGERWSFDGVTIEQWVANDNQAHAYCGIRIEVGQRSVLLAGDFNRAAERDWLARRPHAIGQQPLWAALVPRRAASSASSIEWLAAVRPQVALVTGIAAAGPARTQARTLSRWRDAGAQVLATRTGEWLEITLKPENAAIARRKTANAYPFLWKSDP